MNPKTKLLIAGVIIAAIAAVIIFDLFLKPGPKKQESQSTEADQRTATKTIEEPQNQQHKQKVAKQDSQAPAKSANNVTGQDAPEYYKIQPGDKLWDIAKNKYGDGRYWKLIAQANPQIKPKSLPVGKEIIIPPGPKNKIKGQNSVEEPSDMHDRANAGKDAQRTYTVQPGDSLWEIAKKYDRKDITGMMQKIADANKDKLPTGEETLKVGWVLVIPE